MTSGSFNVELNRLLAGVEPTVALRVLHFATRLISHRRNQGRDFVPWVPNVAGEPDELERALGMEVIRAAERGTGRQLPAWDELIEKEVTEAFFLQAQRLTRGQWGMIGRTEAEEYLDLCRFRIEPPEPEHELRLWAPTNVDDLRKILDALSEQERELVRLRLEGLDWEECGEKLGIEPATAKLRWYRALRRLRHPRASNPVGRADG